MSNFTFPLLSCMILLPIISSIFLTGFEEEKSRQSQYFALVISLIMLGFSWQLISHFDPHQVGFQFEEQLPWIKWLHIHYYLGIDGISMPLVVLTVLTHFIVVISSWHLVNKRVPGYLATFMLLQGLTIGVFAALDSILFYLFWEATLIPMFLSIGIWGSERRTYAATKFFLFTFFGSVLMLIAILYLGDKASTFSIPVMHKLPLTLAEQISIFIALFFALGIKVPMWPVHTWLPDAHTQAPTAGSVILAALMLKLGTYGFLRLSVPIVPDACLYFSTPMIILSMIAIVYVGIVTINQQDMKRLIAYSSIAHMGFVTLGIFLVFKLGLNAWHHYAHLALEGATFQMIAHGFSSAGLFLGFGMLYQRHGSRLIQDFGGIAKVMPIFTAMFVIFCMSNVALPGTAGFVGEFLVILASIKANPFIALITAITVIISASYTLWMVKRVFYGTCRKSLASIDDISILERSTLTILVLGVILLGVYPKPLFGIMHKSIEHLSAQAFVSKIPVNHKS